MVFAGPVSPSSRDSDAESVGKTVSCLLVPRKVFSSPFSTANTDLDIKGGGKEEKRAWKLGINSDYLTGKRTRGLPASREALAKTPKVERDALTGSESGKLTAASSSGADKDPAVAKVGEVIKPFLKMYTLEELKRATQDFEPEAMIGEGGFGKVFKGWVDERTLVPSEVGSGIPVAVKKSDPDSAQGLREWQAEVKFLGKFSHPNFVRLLGFCWEDNHLLLVYEYMPRGSLDNYLFGREVEPLPWDVRLKIMIGAARGVDFLHTPDNNVIYRDFKTSNILLDEDYNAKLADFGLAKQGPAAGNSHVTTEVMGTYRYTAPEYIDTGKTKILSFFSAGDVGSVTTTLFRRFQDCLTCVLRDDLTAESVNQSHLDFRLAKPGPAGGNSHLTTRIMGTYGYAAPEYIATGHLYVKSDVYGFGVVLLEMLTGLQVLNHNRRNGQQNLVEWTRPSLHDSRKLRKIMDPRLKGRYPLKAATEAAKLILKCLVGDPKERPSMDEVLATLEHIDTIREEKKETKASASSRPSSR
ncbi:hypothetical protein BT93_F2949 [Corymbia citriodora subsp. variegata]|nr:hypothetical protein BT93_F2949 [Corymbia citriodora subsp. variegata]